MEVIRKCKKEVKKFQVGDQIVLGRYTATCMTVDNTGATFCFDQVYGENPTKGPYDWRRMKALYKSKAMDSIRDKLALLQSDESEGVDPAETPLLFFRSPTAEEVFAKQRLRAVESSIFPGSDKRWDAMKNGSYRIAATVDGKLACYWLDSIVKPESETAKKFGSGVYTSHFGELMFGDMDAENYIFWRPVFKLKA